MRKRLASWWSNRRVRRTVLYTLLLIPFILASPYLALVWRIILYGEISDQTIIIAIVGIIIYIRALLGLRERKGNSHEGEHAETSKPAETGNGRKPARKRKRKADRR